MAAPSGTLALAPPTERLEKPPAFVALPKTPERPGKTSPRTPVSPSTKAVDHPTITIIRGSQRSASRQSASKAPIPEPQKQKVAALPSGSAANRTATDAPSILVLRGARAARYALARTPQAPPLPLLTVIRGARPRPILLQPYVQPNALILHVRR
jgi:hypothetical protein